MRKLYVVFIICIFLCMTLAGCYDATDIDDYTYAIVLGVDKGSQEKLKITVQYPTFRDGQSGTDGTTSGTQTTTGGYSIISVESPSILNGMNMLNSVIPRGLTLKQLKLLVISEDIAREGVTSVMGLGMTRDVRRPLPTFIAKSGAESFIRQNSSVIGTNIAKSMDFLNEAGHISGFYESFGAIDFYRYLKSEFVQPTAPLAGLSVVSGVIDGDKSHIIYEHTEDVIVKSDTKRNVMGTAVFKGDKMVGELDGDETRVFLMVVNEFVKSNIDVPDPKDPNNLINFDVRMAKHPTITSKIENGVAHIHVVLDIEGNMYAVRSNVNYPDPSLLPLAQNALKEYLQRLANETIKKCQYEYKSDIFGFGNYVVTNFLTIQEWRQYDWLNKFPDAKITTEVNVNIARPGLLNKLSPGKKGDE